jgi:hypothetical protein
MIAAETSIPGPSAAPSRSHAGAAIGNGARKPGPPGRILEGENMKLTNVLNPVHVYRKREWILPKLKRLVDDALDPVREASRVLAEPKRVRRERLLIADRTASGLGRDLRTFDPRSVKRSDTLFILGSGSSINDLSDRDWELVAAHDSVGFNFWPIHPFVPTYFFYEPCVHEDRTALMAARLRARREDYSRTVLFSLIGRWLQMNRPREAYDDDLIARTYFFSAYTFPSNSTSVVTAALRLWAARARARRGEWNRTGITGHRTTADTAMCFGYLCGYRRLVLLGVDLSNSRYFWETDPSRYDPEYFPRNINMGSDSPHNVATPYPYGLLADDYFTLFNRLVLRPAGVELFVGSEQSKLYPRIPLFPDFPRSSRP